MTDKNELKAIAIAALILTLIAFISIWVSNVQTQTKLNAIEIVARHHAQEDADWWQIVDLVGGGE